MAEYHLTYDLESHPEGLPADIIRSMGVGGCDAAIVISIIQHEDGAYSQCAVSMDGRTGTPLAAKDLWKAWALLASTLKDDPSLDGTRRALCGFVHDAVLEQFIRRKS